MNKTGFNFLNADTVPLVIIISGPSGVGKDAILNRMKDRRCPFEFIITLTTRNKRTTETNLVDYQFVTENEFQTLMQKGELLEKAQVYGNWYGVPAKPVREALAKGRDTIIKVDIQGAATIKKIVPEAVLIFIAPPSLEELSRRLRQRCSESTADLSLRLKTAETEMEQVCQFDYVVINQPNKIDQAIEQIQAIVAAEKCRVAPRKVSL